MAWDGKKLQQWFEDRDIGELDWDEGRGESPQDQGYWIYDYERKGYDKGIIELCFPYDGDESWTLQGETKGVTWIEHDNYDVRARIGETHFKLYMPEIKARQGKPVEETVKYNELKAILVGVPTALEIEHSEMDSFLDWHIDPTRYSISSLYR